MTTARGARLILPLRRLDPGEPRPAPTPTQVGRRLDLDAHESGSVRGWHAAVLASKEACLLLDSEARVVAASPTVGAVLGTSASSAMGARFADLVVPIDFTSDAAPDLEPERALPPLRALSTGGLARGLLRVRVPAGLVTYDVVAVPLAGQSGVLAFFLAV